MSDPPADLERAAELAISEMVGRLEEKPEDIPNHVLARLVTDINRAVDRRVKNEDQEDSRPFSLKDELSTLPHNRAKELVLVEIERLEEELRFYEGWLQENEA